MSRFGLNILQESSLLLRPSVGIYPGGQRVASLHLLVGEWVLTMVWTYATTSSSRVLPFWSLWKSCWKMPLLGNQLFYWETSMFTWAMTWNGVIGRYGLPDLIPSGVKFLDFCAGYSLSITNTIFSQNIVHKCRTT